MRQDADATGVDDSARHAGVSVSWGRITGNDDPAECQPASLCE